MVLVAKNDALAIGARLPAFRVKDTTGVERTDANAWSREARGLVVIFMCNHCPYVKAYESRTIALARATMPRGVAWLAVNSNAANAQYPDDSVAETVKRASGYPFPYAADLSQEMARAFGAACTPEFFLFAVDRRLVYTGRLDDEQDEVKVKKHHLADAIEDLLAGRAVRRDRSHPIGCSIKWL